MDDPTRGRKFIENMSAEPPTPLPSATVPEGQRSTRHSPTSWIEGRFGEVAGFFFITWLQYRFAIYDLPIELNDVPWLCQITTVRYA